MAEYHPGEVADVVVELYDSEGNKTNTFDAISGIQWTSTHPEQVMVQDDDAEPKDARVDFNDITPTGEVAVVACRLDGDPGDGVVEIRCESEDITVVPGPARSGRLTLTLRQTEPPPAG